MDPTANDRGLVRRKASRSSEQKNMSKYLLQTATGMRQLEFGRRTCLDINKFFFRFISFAEITQEA